MHLLFGVHPDGSLTASGREARRIVERLGLNRPSYRRFRRLWIGVVAMARQADPQLLDQILGFPESLPDLSSLRPPGGNLTPEGIEQSHFRRRQRGELPEIY